MSYILGFANVPDIDRAAYLRSKSLIDASGKGGYKLTPNG